MGTRNRLAVPDREYFTGIRLDRARGIKEGFAGSPEESLNNARVGNSVRSKEHSRPGPLGNQIVLILGAVGLHPLKVIRLIIDRRLSHPLRDIKGRRLRRWPSRGRWQRWGWRGYPGL